MTNVASGYNCTNSLHSNPKVDTSAYHTFNPRDKGLASPCLRLRPGGLFNLKLLVIEENTPTLANVGAKATTGTTSNLARRDPLGHAPF